MVVYIPVVVVIVVLGDYRCLFCSTLHCLLLLIVVALFAVLLTVYVGFISVCLPFSADSVTVVLRSTIRCLLPFWSLLDIPGIALPAWNLLLPRRYVMVVCSHDLYAVPAWRPFICSNACPRY